MPKTEWERSVCRGPGPRPCDVFIPQPFIRRESVMCSALFTDSEETCVTVLRPSSVTPVLRDPPSPSSCKHSKHTREEMGQENKGWG